LKRHPDYEADAERLETPPGEHDPFAPDSLKRVRCLAALELARETMRNE